jgi:hypothetical protein
MKKFILSIILTSTAIYSNAQLRVNTGGQVTVGSTPTTITKKLTVDGDASVKTKLDVLNLNNTSSGWGAQLRFMPNNGTSPNHTIIDNGQNEMIIYAGFNASSATNLKITSSLNTFTGYTAMTGGGNFSDKRLKQNINTLNYGLETLMQLNPVSYEWNAAAYTKLTSQKELSKNFQGTQVGFIAQEVEALIPEVVKEVKDGYKALEYHNLTAVIVQAVKEQQTIIEAQKLAIEELSQQVEQLKNKTTNVDVLDSEKAFLLEQNRPNPFANSTSIKYSTPENAQLLITNLEGKTMQSIALDSGENRVIEVSAQELHNGIYIYSIVVEGELKLSKRFVVAK